MSAIEKIKKLLALASDGAASEQERETAGRQAASLMAKHEIDEFDLMMSKGGDWDLIESQVSGMRPGKTNGSKVPPWIGILAYGVKCFTHTRCGSVGAHVRFRGPRAQVELATWMLQALIDSCYKASRSYGSNAGAFRNGYASAIQGRLKALAEDTGGDTQTGGSGTSLIVIRDQMSLAMDEKWGTEGGPRTSKCSQSSAGRQAGNSAHIPLNRPMSNGMVQGYLR